MKISQNKENISLDILFFNYYVYSNILLIIWLYLLLVGPVLYLMTVVVWTMAREELVMWSRGVISTGVSTIDLISKGTNSEIINLYVGIFYPKKKGHKLEIYYLSMIA